MMVPSSRLVRWMGLAAVPVAAACSLFPGVFWGCSAMLLVFLGLAVWDAWRGRRRDTPPEVVLPTAIRLTPGRGAELRVVVNSRCRRARTIRLGFQWPEGLKAQPVENVVALEAGETTADVRYACTASRRGVQALAAAFVETRSPWGLWEIRHRQAVRCEIRVYPDLMSERRQIAAVFLNRGSFGTHAQRMVGRGREFEKLRDYLPGDSLEDIHWKTTAKRGRPVTKTYQMERTQEVYVVLDHSRLAGRLAPAVAAAAPGGGADGDLSDAGPDPASVLERFVVAALVLGLAAGKQGDLFGLLTFSDRVHSFLRARSGRAHFEACRESLLRMEPRPVAPDFDEMFTFVRLRLRRRALLVVLTALDDPLLAETFSRSLSLVQRQHLVLVNVLRPDGVEPMFERPAIASPDSLYEALGGHLRWHALRELQQALQHRGVRLSLLENERLAAELVRQYLDVKHRQQL